MSTEKVKHWKNRFVKVQKFKNEIVKLKKNVKFKNDTIENCKSWKVLKLKIKIEIENWNCILNKD